MTIRRGGSIIAGSVKNELIDVVATGTTTARTLPDRFADVINVKDFGAKGDGVTDDTTAFQSAITHGIDNNKTIYVPGGTYKITSVSTQTYYTSTYRKILKIIGTSGTMIEVSGSITIGDGIIPIIKDIFIDGLTSEPAVILGNDYHTYNGYFHGVRIQGRPTAVYLKHCFDIGFEDCRFASYGTYEESIEMRPVIIFGKGSSEWTVDQSANNITFTRCQWENTMGNGVQVYFPNENGSNPYVISFFGCHFESRNRNSRAFHIEKGQTIGFYNCTFTNNDNPWVENDAHTRAVNHIESAEGVNIVNCMFDRYDNNMIEFGNNVKFFNISATTLNEYSFSDYMQLSTFFTLNSTNTDTWKCLIQNGYNSTKTYEYNHHNGKPSEKYEDITLGSSGSAYLAPADGYVTLSKYSNDTNQSIGLINQLSDASRQMHVRAYSSAEGQRLAVIIPVKKGDWVIRIYNAGGATDIHRFIYAEGEK